MKTHCQPLFHQKACVLSKSGISTNRFVRFVTTCSRTQFVHGPNQVVDRVLHSVTVEHYHPNADGFVASANRKVMTRGHAQTKNLLCKVSFNTVYYHLRINTCTSLLLHTCPLCVVLFAAYLLLCFSLNILIPSTVFSQAILMLCSWLMCPTHAGNRENLPDQDHFFNKAYFDKSLLPSVLS